MLQCVKAEAVCGNCKAMNPALPPRLKAAADALKKSPLALNKGLMDKLAKASAQLKQLSPGELQKLKDEVEKAGGT